MVQLQKRRVQSAFRAGHSLSLLSKHCPGKEWKFRRTGAAFFVTACGRVPPPLSCSLQAGPALGMVVWPGCLPRLTHSQPPPQSQ